MIRFYFYTKTKKTNKKIGRTLYKMTKPTEPFGLYFCMCIQDRVSFRIVPSEVFKFILTFKGVRFNTFFDPCKANSLCGYLHAREECIHRSECKQPRTINGRRLLTLFLSVQGQMITCDNLAGLVSRCHSKNVQ